MSVKALQLTLPLAPVRWHFVSQSVDAAFPISSDPIMTLDVQAVRGQEYLGFSPKAGGDLASAMRYPDYPLQQPVHAVGCWHLPDFVHAALTCSAAEGMVLHLFACPAPFGGPFLPVPRLHAALPLRVILQTRFQQLLLLDSRLHGSAAIIAELLQSSQLGRGLLRFRAELLACRLRQRKHRLVRARASPCPTLSEETQRKAILELPSQPVPR